MTNKEFVEICCTKERVPSAVCTNPLDAALSVPSPSSTKPGKIVSISGPTFYMSATYRISLLPEQAVSH